MRSKMTTFASAATPIVRINPAKPGSVSVTPNSTIAAYMNARVDGEADHRDEAEEAVEQQQEDRDEDQAADRGVARLLQRVLAERRRDVGALDGTKLHRQRTRLQHEREVLRLREARHAGDLRAAAASG